MPNNYYDNCLCIMLSVFECFNHASLSFAPRGCLSWAQPEVALPISSVEPSEPITPPKEPHKCFVWIGRGGMFLVCVAFALPWTLGFWGASRAPGAAPSTTTICSFCLFSRPIINETFTNEHAYVSRK